jgi:hypothetical protein
MIHTTRRSLRWLALALLLTGLTPAARADFTLGGFDLSRGGGFSLRDGSLLTDFRAAISSAFPGSTLTASPTLTPAYLSTIQDLIVTSPTGDSTATAPLSSSEQAALLNFVKGGGSAIILVDNDTFAGQPTSSNVNNSFISPFGLHVTGTVTGLQQANVTDFSSLVTNGPFGKVTSFTTSFVGWFDNLGPNATALASLAANG